MNMFFSWWIVAYILITITSYCLSFFKYAKMESMVRPALVSVDIAWVEILVPKPMVHAQVNVSIHGSEQDVIRKKVKGLGTK